MKHSRHRNQLARIKRSWYRELREDGYTAKLAKKRVEHNISFMDGIQRLAFERGIEIEVNCENI